MNGAVANIYVSTWQPIILRVPAPAAERATFADRHGVRGGGTGIHSNRGGSRGARGAS